MTDIDVTRELPIPVERPRPASAGLLGWLRANLFNGPLNTILTVAAVYLFVVTIPPIVRWGFVDANWSADSGRACRGDGACWEATYSSAVKNSFLSGLVAFSD